MWKLKKRILPRKYDPPMAKRDNNGNLATSKVKLKNLYKFTYIDRLSQNNIKPELKLLHKWKDLLCNRRLEYASNIKTNPWSKDEINKILKNLKNNKAMDSMNLVNELFKPNVAGDDLTNSIVSMMNMVKHQLVAPDLMKKELIYSIYKNSDAMHILITHAAINQQKMVLTKWL